MAELSEQTLKSIIARRDQRFDGRFYFGVRTTRIYCRPVCPARPKPENIVIFKSPSAAEAHGYRPCLRCHPDLAPGSKRLDGTTNTVTRALRIIQDAAEAAPSVEALAATLGVTGRHLRRLFDEHLGASPVEIMITQRLHFAKQTLQETNLPVAEIAFAAGFRSIRRFNEAFKARFHQSPTTLREARKAAILAEDGVMLRLPIRLPYDWETVIAYLARHATYGVERIAGDTYQRFLPHGRTFGSVTVAKAADRDWLDVRFVNVPLRDMRQTLARLKVLFDTDHNPLDLPATPGSATRPLQPQGIRVPGSFDPFETAVAIILGQLVSTEAAKTGLKKLVERFGKRLGGHGGDDVYAFPTAAVLADAPIEATGQMQSKAAAIRALAAAVRDGAFDFKAHVDFAEARANLLALKGIGHWTAAMIGMRCLGDPDAFPEFDLIVRRVVAERLVDPEPWLSSRAYLTHCLWRDYAGTTTPRQRKKGRPS